MTFLHRGLKYTFENTYAMYAIHSSNMYHFNCLYRFHLLNVFRKVLEKKSLVIT